MISIDSANVTDPSILLKTPFCSNRVQSQTTGLTAQDL